MIFSGIRRSAASLAGLAVVSIVFGLAQYPRLVPAERTRSSAHFHFAKRPLQEANDHPVYKNVREVHPSLQRISSWISSLGAGAALADLDGDGLPNDLVWVDPRTDWVTVTPVPGTGDRYLPFELSPKLSLGSGTNSLPFDRATMAPMGALVGDFNEDGRLDVLVYYWGRSPIIFLRNSGAGGLSRSNFTAIELVKDGGRWYSNAAIEGDLDGDGHVDLIVGNYFPDGAHILDASGTGIETMHEGKAKALNGGEKHAFRWIGGKSGSNPEANFVEVPNLFRPEVNRGWTLAMGVADLDGDQLPELYFSHDFGPDRLLHNESTPGHLKFTELEGKRDFFIPKSCVLGHDSFKGMGCDFGDLNGDGLFDIYVSNIATRYALTESHFLWQSTGQVDQMRKGVAPYFQNSEALGLSRSGWGWDCRLVDFDNDGVLEAIQAVGFIKGTINRWPELQALGTSNSKLVHDPRVWPAFKPGADLSGHDLNPFFVRASDGRYYDIGEEVGFDTPMVSKGIAVADVDGDGRMDFVFANQWEPSYYFHNEAPQAGAFLGLHLLLPLEGAGTTTLIQHPGHPGSGVVARPAYGAQAVALLENNKRVLGQVDGGSGHSGRRSPDIHLGLGTIDSNQPVQTVIKWRDSTGFPHLNELRLKPGWHTILLGAGPEANRSTAFNP